MGSGRAAAGGSTRTRLRLSRSETIIERGPLVSFAARKAGRSFLDAYVLDLLVLEPLEQRLLLLRQLHFGHVGRVEGGDEIKDPLIDPAGDLLRGEPVLTLGQGR